MTAPNIDLSSPDLYLDGGATYRWLRDNAPVHLDETSGMWALATYDTVLAAERDATTFSNAGGSRPDTGPLPWMIDMDGAAHRKRRQLVSGAFTPARVRAKAGDIARICDELIDAVCERGECDIVADLAAPLPMIVIGDMLGIAPHERADLLRWSDDMLGSLTGDSEHVGAAAAAFVEYDAYARRTIAARRREPVDDLFSVLVHAEVDGSRLTDDEIVFESLHVLVGGDETTRHVISGGIEQLLAHEAARQALVDDLTLLPTAVEEMLRWVSPIKSMARTVTRDVELGGRRLVPGDKLLLLYESANFDDAHFVEPATFDIRRSPNDHLAFGFGAHFCLGASLARLEVATMLERVLSRMADIELVADEGVSRFFTGIARMPVRFTPSPRLAG
jgi:cytochrome P450 family 142 subfamily A polypeptide 1